MAEPLMRLKVLVYEASSYFVYGLKLLVYAALSHVYCSVGCLMAELLMRLKVQVYEALNYLCVRP
jgi:hypothetical protein